MSNTFDQGWAARPFKEQFPELDDQRADYLDSLNRSITAMLMSGLLTESQARDIRLKKFPKVVSKEVSAARRKTIQQQAEGE